MADHGSITGGVVLAGGRSSRFGAEKAVARWGGRVLIDVVIERFAGLGPTAVSVRAGSATERHVRARGLDVLYDDPLHPRGPLAGLAAGLAWADRHGLAIIATAPCDTPRLPIDLYPALLNRLGPAPAAFATTRNGPHPLCAVWRTGVLAPLLALLSDRHPSVQNIHARLGSVPVQFGDAAAFANANTPEALAALEKSL